MTEASANDSDEKSDRADERSGGGPSPTAPPTCFECDDEAGNKKTDALVDTDANTVIIVMTPPTAAPTCVECDDGPKPTPPPSSLPMPEKKPTDVSDSTLLDTLLNNKSDGDPLDDSLLHLSTDEASSGTHNSVALSLINISVGCFMLLWTSG